MTGNGKASGDDRVATVSNSRSSLALKDFLLSTTRRLSSNKAQLFSSRSQEHVMHDQTDLYPPLPPPDQAMSTTTTAFLDGGDPTAGLRCRTSSLTLDAAGRGSKESDSGNSSLMDSSSADSYQELGSDTRSRTTSSCKSDQSLASDHHHDHQDLFDQRRKRNSSMTDSISSSSSSGKVSLNASDTTETPEVADINNSSSRDKGAVCGNCFVHLDAFPESQPFLCHPTQETCLNTGDFNKNRICRSTDAINSVGYSRQCNQHFSNTDESDLFFSPFSSASSNFTVDELSILKSHNRLHDKTRHCSFTNYSLENKDLLTSADVFGETGEDLLADMSWQSGTATPRRSSSLSRLQKLPLNDVQQLDETEIIDPEPTCSSRYLVDSGLNQAAGVSKPHDHHVYSTHSTSTAREQTHLSSTQPDPLVTSPAAGSLQAVPSTILVPRQLSSQSSSQQSPQSQPNHLNIFESAQSPPLYPYTQTAIPSKLHQPNSKDNQDLFSSGNPPKHSDFSNTTGENSLARTECHESLLQKFTPKKTSPKLTPQTSPKMQRPRTPISATFVAKNPVQNLKFILGCGSPVSTNALQQKIESCPGVKTKPLQVLVPSYRPPEMSHSKSTSYTTDNTNRSFAQSITLPLSTNECPQKEDAPVEMIHNISRTVPISQITSSHTLPNFKSRQILDNFEQSENPGMHITQGQCVGEVPSLNSPALKGHRCESICCNQCFKESLHASMLRPKTHYLQMGSESCPSYGRYDTVPFNCRNYRRNGHNLVSSQNSKITSELRSGHLCPTLSTQSDSWPVDSNPVLSPPNPNSLMSPQSSYYWSQQRAARSHCTCEIDFGQDVHPNLDSPYMPSRNIKRDYDSQAQGIYTDKNLEPAPYQLGLLDDELKRDSALEDTSTVDIAVKLDFHSSSVELAFQNKAQRRNCIRNLEQPSQPALYKSGEGEDNNNQEQQTLLNPIVSGTSKTQPLSTDRGDLFHREIPDYKLLCLAAAILNPILGLLALICNQQARLNLRRHRPTRANNCYFATITLSTVAIFLTLMGAALLLAQHLVLTGGQSDPTPDPFSDQTCRDRFFLSDDSLLKFYQVDLQLYCRITLNVKLMEALKNYHLQHITSKQRHAKQQNLTLADLGMSSPDLIREAVGLKPGEIKKGSQDQSFDALAGMMEMVNESKVVEHVSNFSSGETGAVDEMFSIFNNISTNTTSAASVGDSRGKQQDEMVASQMANEKAGSRVNSGMTSSGESSYLSPSSDQGSDFVRETQAVNATELTEENRAPH